MKIFFDFCFQINFYNFFYCKKSGLVFSACLIRKSLNDVVKTKKIFFFWVLQKSLKLILTWKESILVDSFFKGKILKFIKSATFKNLMSNSAAWEGEETLYQISSLYPAKLKNFCRKRKYFFLSPSPSLSLSRLLVFIYILKSNLYKMSKQEKANWKKEKMELLTKEIFAAKGMLFVRNRFY